MVSFAQYYQRAKNVIHAIQALAIFVAWAMIIALLTKGGKLDGRIWYYFALVGNFQSLISLRREAKDSYSAGAAYLLSSTSQLLLFFNGYAAFPMPMSTPSSISSTRYFGSPPLPA